MHKCEKVIQINVPKQGDDNLSINEVRLSSEDSDLTLTLRKKAGCLAKSIMQSNMDLWRDFLDLVAIVAKNLDLQLHSNNESFFASLSTIIEAVVRALPTELPDEDREAIIYNCQQWGRLGWTLAFAEDINAFLTPLDNDDIINHNYMQKQFREYGGEQRLFEELQRIYKKDKDLESAITCYNLKQNKACAMLLFSMIDRRLIKLQGKPSERNKRRQVGNSAVKHLEDVFNCVVEEDTTFVFYYSISIVECLKTMFANAKDFTLETPIINRNYLAHGMHKGVVRKRDCIQLFLLLSGLNRVLSELGL